MSGMSIWCAGSLCLGFSWFRQQHWPSSIFSQFFVIGTVLYSIVIADPLLLFFKWCPAGKAVNMESIGLDMDDLFDEDAPTLEEQLEGELDVPELPDLEDMGNLPMAEDADAGATEQADGMT